MQIWHWWLIVIATAMLFTGAIYLYANGKKIFKIKKKEKKPKEKRAKVAKKQKNIPQPQEDKPEEELSLTEQKKQKKPEVVGGGQMESYSPSAEFAAKPQSYSSAFDQPIRRRRPLPLSTSFPSMPDFENDVEENKPIKEQIKNLSPQMKAILFGNILDRKDDLF